MKNISLLGILITLLLMTYLFQEKKILSSPSQEENKLFAFDIKTIKTPFWEAYAKNGLWWSKEKLLSHFKFNTLVSKLGNIKIKKIIEGDWKQFSFLSNLEMKINGKILIVGDYSLDKKSRYIFYDGVIYLCSMMGENQVYAQNEDEISQIKWQEFLGIAQQNIDQLKETQFFRFFPNLQFDKVKVSSNSFFSYEINFSENTTTPSPLSGIVELPQLKQKFLSLFNSIVVKEELDSLISFESDQKLGEISFFQKKDEAVTKMELWQKEKGKADIFIWDHLTGKKFLVVGGTLKLFFIHVQDYWDKKVIPPHAFSFFESTQALFKQNGRSAEVTVYNTEPLSFKTKNYKIQHDHLKAMFQYLFNLGNLEQADRVSMLKKSELKMTENMLHVSLFGEELILWKKENELIVINATRGFKAHFYDGKVMTQFEDVLR